MVVVSAADQMAAYAQFAVVRDTRGDAAHRHADRADPIVLRQAHAHRPAGLRHAVALKQRHADAVEEVRKVGIHRGAAGDGEVGVRAENRADLLVHHQLVEPVGEAPPPRQFLAGLLGLRPIPRHVRRTQEHLAGDALAGALRRCVIHLLEHARHRQQQRRAERLEILDDRLHVGTQSQRQRAAEAQQLHEPREHVAQRQEQQQTAVGPRAGAGHVLHGRQAQERQIAVRQLHALGGAGGAGRVDDRREVVAVGVVLARPELLVAHFLAIRLQGFERAGLDHEHLAQRLHLIVDGFDLVALPVVLGERDRGLRIVEDPAHLSVGIRLVDRDGERPDRHDGHVERGPFPARTRHD